MKANVGKADKIIRIVIGIVIAVLGVCFQSWWGLIAIMPLVTAFAGIFPGYLPFGISSSKSKV